MLCFPPFILRSLLFAPNDLFNINDGGCLECPGIARSRGTQPMTNTSAKVASNALKHFGQVVHPQAIRIFTPFTNPVPLRSCKLNADLKRFLVAYEPKIESSGLFPHQADFLNAYAEGGNENFIITTATGSGKSLLLLVVGFRPTEPKRQRYGDPSLPHTSPHVGAG